MPIADRTIFVIGTEESVREVLEIKAMVQEVAERSLGVARAPEETEGPSEDNVADYCELLRTINKETVPNKGERGYQWETVEDEREESDTDMDEDDDDESSEE